MKIITLAGHIDHGKTSLISAISGFWGDSSPQERERGITIDLSFSDYEGISFVDVPGHENLLRTMLAGSLSPYALLVIDINEGVMPQTIEHIFALQNLGASCIILALNKCDLCANVQAAKEGILAELNALGCEVATVFLTSAKTQFGIEQLREYLLHLEDIAPRKSALALRLHIDRVFSLRGSGQIATGFLSAGELKAGDYMALVGGKIAPIKVRSLQVQHKEAESAKALSRVALSFRGELEVGSEVFIKGQLRASREIYAKINWLHAALKDGAYVRLCAHTASVNARVYEVGEFVKIELEKPLALVFGDRLLLLSSGRIAGGGRVLCPLVEPLKKRRMIKLLEHLAAGEFASAFSALNQAHPGGFGLFSAPQRFNMSVQDAARLASQNCEIVNEDGASCYTQAHLDALVGKIRRMYEKNKFAMQSAASLAISLNEEEFLCKKALELLRASALLRSERGLFMRADVEFQAAEHNAQDELKKAIDRIDALAPYNIYEQLGIDKKLGDNILKALCARQQAVRLAHNYFISAAALKDAMQQLKALSAQCDGVGVQELKAHLGVSRKYAIALLEYADAQGAARVGDKRYFKERK